MSRNQSVPIIIERFGSLDVDGEMRSIVQLDTNTGEERTLFKIERADHFDISPGLDFVAQIEWRRSPMLSVTRMSDGEIIYSEDGVGYIYSQFEGSRVTEYSTAWSSDGQRLAYEKSNLDDDGSSVWLLDINSLETVEVPDNNTHVNHNLIWIDETNELLFKTVDQCLENPTRECQREHWSALHIVDTEQIDPQTLKHLTTYEFPFHICNIKVGLYLVFWEENCIPMDGGDRYAVLDRRSGKISRSQPIEISPAIYHGFQAEFVEVEDEEFVLIKESQTDIGFVIEGTNSSITLFDSELNAISEIPRSPRLSTLYWNQAGQYGLVNQNTFQDRRTYPLSPLILRLDQETLALTIEDSDFLPLNCGSFSDLKFDPINLDRFMYIPAADIGECAEDGEHDLVLVEISSSKTKLFSYSERLFLIRWP